MRCWSFETEITDSLEELSEKIEADFGEILVWVDNEALNNLLMRLQHKLWIIHLIDVPYRHAFILERRNTELVLSLRHPF